MSWQTTSRTIPIRTLALLTILFGLRRFFRRPIANHLARPHLERHQRWNGRRSARPSEECLDRFQRLPASPHHQEAGKWTASELFTVDTLGFGTYQWVVQGDVWTMDPVTVLGLFPYGPANGIGKDGSNEIDIEFSQWDKTCNCNADFTIYPSVRRAKGQSSFERNFTVSNGTDLTTARMEWNSNRIVLTLMSGNQPIGTTANVLKTATYQTVEHRRHSATAAAGRNQFLGLHRRTCYQPVGDHPELSVRSLTRRQLPQLPIDPPPKSVTRCADHKRTPRQSPPRFGACDRGEV